MERQKKVVIDASVAAKWFLNEPGTEEALKLREEHISGKLRIIVPELIFIEVLNAVMSKNMNHRALVEVNEALWSAELQIERLTPFILFRAIKISLEKDLTLYDSVYGALSQMLECNVITADRDLGRLPNAVKI